MPPRSSHQAPAPALRKIVLSGASVLLLAVTTVVGVACRDREHHVIRTPMLVDGGFGWPVAAEDGGVGSIGVQMHSDLEIVLCDGGPCSYWPLGAVVRYEVFVPHWDEYRECLRARLSEDGRALAQLRVTPRGLEVVTLSSTPPDNGFEACVRRLMSKVPTHTDGGSVLVEIAF